jgi:hypothetical protein
MKLEHFWHRSIRRILKIGMMQVKEERITNERIRKFFMNIPSAEDTITARQLTYIGKIVRGPNNHPPNQLLTAWTNNPRPQGGVLTTNKKAIVRSLHTLIPSKMMERIIFKNNLTGESEVKHVLNKN